MTAAFERFVANGRSLAERHGFIWDPPHDGRGIIAKESRWDLGRAAGATSPVWLSSFGWGPSLLGAAEKVRPGPLLAGDLLSREWRDLYQAAVMDLIFVQQQAAHSAYRMATFLKLVALGAEGVTPIELRSHHVRLGYNIALHMADGEAARVFPGYIRKVFDAPHLVISPNLATNCTPFATVEAAKAQGRVDQATARSAAKGYGSNKRVLDSLYDRKDELKLPDTRSFWEFCRIVFTEQPRSLHDLQLFASGRMHVICGFRAAEIALLPLDWKRWRDWVDAEGAPAGQRGGISRSLGIRHFAGKQGEKSRGPKSRQFVTKVQDVAEMFEDIVLHTLDEVAAANAPLRETLRGQILSGRIFPDLETDDLLPLHEVYARVYGNIQLSSLEIPDGLINKYRSGYEVNGGESLRRFCPTVLDEIRDDQVGKLTRHAKSQGREGALLHEFARQYWNDNRAKVSRDLFRDATGAPVDYCKDFDWHATYMRVGEVEDEIRRRKLDKTLSSPSFNVDDGTLIGPHEFLFLTAHDKGGVRTDRNILDAKKFYAVRRFEPHEILRSLGGNVRVKHLSLFARYGRTEEDRNLEMRSHSVRHLQTTELFRKGISDAIITKRFDRTSVQQSHVYDHRSLIERLEEISLPPAREASLGPKAAATYRLIASGQVAGPVVEGFRRIQRAEGDDAAFEFLIAEADGLHATPYGFCLNSFTVDPCPKHLECFNGCLHLARTNLAGEQNSLTKLRERTASALAKAEQSPKGSVGLENQLAHGRAHLENIDKALRAVPGERPFPDGRDLSKPIDRVLNSTILDSPPPFRPLSPPASGLCDG